jgi:uncharacterized membrane protein YeaQ/YmgE (transglycosylase-associated protein family)
MQEMNVMIWILAGGIAGWVGCSVLHVNAARGLVLSAIIGAAGAFFGGSVLAPVFGGLAVPGAFSAFALLIAFTTAVAVLSISDMVYERFGY